jgi:hypothetical protein
MIRVAPILAIPGLQPVRTVVRARVQQPASLSGKVIERGDIAHDYAGHHATLANEANAALDSAVIYVTEAALAYLRIETGAPLGEKVIVMPKGRVQAMVSDLSDDVADEDALF